MAIDTSMYGNIKPIQLENPLTQFAQVSAIENAQNQNRLADLMFGEKQRGIAEEKAMNQLYAGAVGADGAIDRNKLYSSMAQGGFGSKLQTVQKGFAEADEKQSTIRKNDATARKTGFEAANLALTQHRDLLNTVNDPATARQWLVAAYQNPDTKGIFERMGPLEVALQRFDQGVTTPETFAKWKMGASMNAEKLVEYTTPNANTVANNNTSIQTTGMNNATSVRTTGMNNATSVKTTGMNNATSVQTTGMTNATSRANNADTISATAAKDKALTETQGNATMFASRMKDASSTLVPLEEKGINASNPRTMAAGNIATNWMASNEGQQYMQAARNWVTANLRKESGAAIPDPELASEIKKYFAMPGDGKDVIAQKRQARAVAEEGMLVQAGPGAQKIQGVLDRGGSKAGSRADPLVGSVKDGYKFKGGNPADPSSWEKQ